MGYDTGKVEAVGRGRERARERRGGRVGIRTLLRDSLVSLVMDSGSVARQRKEPKLVSKFFLVTSWKRI